jgi:hypothetical protein
MEDIKHRLSEQNYYFLKKLQDYIDCELIFLGSIKRPDFLQKHSDIDIAIISDNIENTLVKLQHFLNLPNRKIRKIFQKLPLIPNLIYGYKTNYNDVNNNLSLEIVLYNEKYKTQVMENVSNSINLPFYITYILLLIKLLYYELNIISGKTCKYLKNSLIKLYQNQELYDDFITIKI